MKHISHLLITSDESDVGDDIEIYISDKKMDQLGSYGNNNEMLTLSHLLTCTHVSYTHLILCLKVGLTWLTLVILMPAFL